MTNQDQLSIKKTVRFTEEEVKWINRQRADMTFSDYARSVLLSEESIARDYENAKGLLTKINGMFSQIEFELQQNYPIDWSTMVERINELLPKAPEPRSNPSHS